MQAARAASAASGAASISGRHLGAQQRPAAPLPHRLRANPAGALLSSSCKGCRSAVMLEWGAGIDLSTRGVRWSCLQ